MAITDQPGVSTQERLIAAAGPVFAEVGFRDATVRDICSRAGVNIAAVNYHFRDKEGLYAAVLRCAHESAARQHPLEGIEGAPGSAEDRLRGFIEMFMRRLFDESRPAWQTRLMAREMVEPTAALDQVVERAIRPQFDLLCSLVREVVGAGVGEDRVAMCASSIVGQCLLYHHCRPVVQRLFPTDAFTAARAAERAAHIADFSLSALASFRGPPGVPPAPPPFPR